jgi:hypothetical protein
MKKSVTFAALAAGLCISLSSFAQVPASAPAGTTGLCKDGSFSSSAVKKGACQGHKGVKKWYGAAAAGTAAMSTAGAATMGAANTAGTTMNNAAMNAANNTAMNAKNAMTSAGNQMATATPVAAAMAGGGAGQVWVNTKTHVYHCSTDPYYGKTKQGAYLSEAAAKAAGDHPAHGKTCS